MLNIVRFQAILSTVLLLAFVSHVQSEPTVHMSIVPSVQAKFGQRIRVTCIVWGVEDPDFREIKVKFNCPVFPKDRNGLPKPCFQDCKQACSPGSGCTLQQSQLINGVSCSSFKEPSKRTFEYEFTYSSDMYAGDYSCAFFNKKTGYVSIPRAKRPPSTVKPTTRPTPSSTKKSTTIRRPTKAKETNLINVNRKKTGEYTSMPCIPASTQIPEVDVHRERIVVTVIVLLIFSLALNVVVCVRCVLQAHYNKYPSQKRRMTHLLCLSEEPPAARQLPQGSLTFAPSMISAYPVDDTQGSDSTYSVPTSQVAYGAMPHARSTLPVMSGINGSNQNIVFVPVLASSINTLQSASHPRLNSPMPDNISIGYRGGGASGGPPPPSVPLRESNPVHRLSNGSGIMPRVRYTKEEVRNSKLDIECHPESETLID